MPRKCEICGCSELDPCPVGCFWVELEMARQFGCMDLCDTCAGCMLELIQGMIQFWEITHGFYPSRLLNALQTVFDQPPVEPEPLIVVARS